MYTPAYDKSLHFMAGVLLFALFHFIHPFIGLLAAFLYALGKEVYDYYHPQEHKVELLDFLYTIAGGMAGFISSL